MGDRLTLLLIEDSEADCLLIERHLRRHGLVVACQQVASASTLAQALDDGTWDAVLADYNVPGLDFWDSLSRIQARAPDLPVILVSGSLGEEAAVDLLKQGVSDVVLKDSLARLVPALERSLRESADRRGRREAELALQQSEIRYRALVETSFDWIWEVDPDFTYTYVSPRVREILGHAPEEVTGQPAFAFVPEDEARRVRPILAQVFAERRPFSALESVHQHRDGRSVVLETSGVPVFGTDGAFKGYRGTHRDVTARKEAERRLAAQDAVSRVLAESESLREATPRIIQALCDAEGWDVGTIWEVDPQAGVLRCTGLWNALGAPIADFAARTIETTIAPGVCLPGKVWVTGAPVFISDLRRDDACPRAALTREAGLETAVGFPILRGGQITGVVDLWRRQRREPDARLLDLFSGIGRQIGQFMERRRAQEEVRRFVSFSPAVIYALRVQPDGLRSTWISDNVLQLTGYGSGEVLGPGWWRDHIHSDDWPRVIAACPTPYDVEHQVLEYRVRRKDGGYFWVRDERRLLRDAHGSPAEVIGSWSDITQRVHLEERLRQSQKMEAVGQLAGGVAHDFNNLLTIIIMSMDTLASRLPAEDGRRSSVATVRHAAERAAALTRQLLAFSRKQVLEPKVLDLNEVVGNVERMLRRLIGEDIVLTTVLSPHVNRVKVDPGQMEQVVINLAVNARDAMPQGGHLTLETRAVELDEDYCRLHPDSRPGRYTLLSVTDTGAGMPPDVKPRIFEPFFTTKGPGKGTGLGLATVFGIVKQSDGHIDFDSTVGVGTCFRIYLPAVEARGGAPPSEGSGGPARTGSETILLVEDEDGVRDIAKVVLGAHGYRVIEAASGREAIMVAERSGVEIQLLLSDVVMPEMSGRQLAERLRERYPGLRVLFMSGYTDDTVVRHGVTDSNVAFLQKPFSPRTLARKVRDVLDGTP